jgi:hypothetical protein
MNKASFGDINLFEIYVVVFVGRDNSEGLATRYGLGDPGIELHVGERFFASVQTGFGAHPASYTMDTGSVSRV